VSAPDPMRDHPRATRDALGETRNAPSPVPPAAPAMSGRAWWALAAIVFLSVNYESLFLFRGINRLDESWQLYAAMRMHDGGTLYRDVLWVFPPGHVWAAWFAWWLDPPGLVFARVVYAAFDVALAAASYFLARRLMPEPFAFLAALLVTFAAPRGHLYQLLFGFRYLVIPFLALIAFDRRLRGGDARWIWLAGACMGLALTFRLTPAFSASCGVAVALLACHRRWQDWLAEGLRFSGGLLLAVAPTLVWFQLSVGLDRVWYEVVVHPLAMLQALPLPPLEVPEVWDRYHLRTLFVAFQFRAIWVFYAVCLGGLALVWARARRRGEPFRHGLLLALVVFGAVFFVRSTGRSDEPHLDSVIPPVCVLVAHALSLGFARLWPAGPAPGRRRFLAACGVAFGAFAAWVFLLETDAEFVRPVRMRPIDALDGRIATAPPEEAHAIDRTVELILQYTEPDETILNLAPTPLFHVLTRRTGPGWFDLIMPGIFVTEEDERWFLARLRADPPAAVVWPKRVFDDMPERAVTAVAPLVTEWVRANYQRAPGQQDVYIVLVRRDRLAGRVGRSRWVPVRPGVGPRRRADSPMMAGSAMGRT